jgi:hypothetical protein
MINFQSLNNKPICCSNHQNQPKYSKVSLSQKPDVVELSFRGSLPERLPVENLMIKARQEILKKVDPQHLQNLDMVKSNFINGRVRPQLGSNPDLMMITTSTDQVGSLDRTIELFEAPEDIKVWRAFSINDYASGIEKVDEFLSKYFFKGRQTRMPVYMSTSFDRKISERFLKDDTNQVLAEITAKKGTKCVSMEELTPGDVYGNEQEVLFPRNTFLIWTGLDKVNVNGKDYTLMKMEAKTPEGFNSEIKDYVVPKPPLEVEGFANLEALFKSFE